MTRRWLLLIYTVPTIPSRTRAYAWREIRREGALLLRDGVAALPDSSAARRWCAEIAGRIGDGGGTAMMATATFAAAHDRRLVATLRQERDREYSEITEACAGLLEHIGRERQHAQFTFEELEELESDMGKIQRWFADVRRRDRFDASGAQEAERAIARCERHLRRFMERASREDEARRASGPLATVARRTRTRGGGRG